MGSGWLFNSDSEHNPDRGKAGK